MIATRRLLTVLIIACVAAVAACGGDVSGPDRARSELEINRDKWGERGYHDYSLTMTRQCFCLDVGPFAVTVRGDSIVAAVDTSDGAPARSHLPTVNRLFDFIQKAIDDHATTIRVTYDEDLGYPREIEYDLATNIADEEVNYKLDSLKPIPNDL